MKITYKIMRISEAIEQGAPYPEHEISFLEGYESGVWRCADGVPVELIGEDGGEPEDQTLRRDWSWIAPALQSAYEMGLEAGVRHD